MLSLGKEVHNIGIAPTPTLKATVKLMKASAGIMITASHNPLTWNGFKFVDENGFFFDEKKQKKWLNALDNQIEVTNSYLKSKPLTTNNYFALDGIHLHIQSILDYLDPSYLKLIRSKKYKVAIDAVHGAGSTAVPKLLEALGCQVFPLHCDDLLYVSEFPRPPEPTPSALKKLLKFSKHNNVDVGFALDPDADRLVLASAKEGLYSEEYTLPCALLGLHDILKERKDLGKKNNVIINLSTSSLCNFFKEEYNLQVDKAPVGEANVVALMKRKKAILGGEGNGGVIVPSIPSYGRDPLIGITLILLAMAQKKAKKIEHLMGLLPPLFMEKRKYKLKKEALEETLSRLLLELPSAKMKAKDGFILNFSDESWLHIRKSNTEPIIRLILEAPSQKRLNELLKTSNKVLL